MVTCKRVINTVEQFAPAVLAEEWDNIGLQVGNSQAEVSGILVTLDVTLEVVKEAVGLGVGMIVSHHPLIFRPLKQVRGDQFPGAIIHRAIKENLNIFSAHTNADSCSRGVNACLAKKIGLTNIQVLQPNRHKLYKLVVFVPEGYQDTLRKAMGDSGAGWLGNYSHCTFMALGTGSFKPLDKANPFIGKTGKLEEVAEYRLETIVPENLLQDTVNSVLEAHPYEEAAYDIYPLENSDTSQGMGRIGKLPHEISLKELGEKVKQDLDCPWVLISGNQEEMVQTVAVCGGSGAEFIPLAKARKADVLITGDVKYHQAMTARELGINLIDPGHNATERVIIPELAQYLRIQLNSEKEQVAVFESKVDTNPWDAWLG